ncbi:hypothetical protein GCM10010269_14140 [Streptomyces humidus]|uniref:Uncharacterized protein n=1 Tax=Streptomyces humidus TaxID=52259 RepID=A0A918FS88_9ACTN|nr:hypothetical protein GCM10010269_14140 [Streptomyces humidus]
MLAMSGSGSETDCVGPRARQTTTVWHTFGAFRCIAPKALGALGALEPPDHAHGFPPMEAELRSVAREAKSPRPPDLRAMPDRACPECWTTRARNGRSLTLGTVGHRPIG